MLALIFPFARGGLCLGIIWNIFQLIPKPRNILVAIRVALKLTPKIRSRQRKLFWLICKLEIRVQVNQNNCKGSIWIWNTQITLHKIGIFLLLWERRKCSIYFHSTIFCNSLKPLLIKLLNYQEANKQFFYFQHKISVF